MPPGLVSKRRATLVLLLAAAVVACQDSPSPTSPPETVSDVSPEAAAVQQKSGDGF